MRPLFSILILCFLLTACARSMPEDLSRSTLTDGQVAEQFSGADSSAVLTGWLATFNDARLLQLADEAIVANRDLAVAAARVQEAAAVAEQAGASLKPTVALAAKSSTGGTLLGSDLGSNYGAGLNMSWELDLWGRLRAATAAAEATYKASELDFEAARQSLAAQLAKSWFFAVEAQKQETLATQIVDVQKRLTDTVSELVAVGKVPERDLLMTRAELAGAQERLRQTRAAREQATRALEIMLGRYPKAELALAEFLPPVPPTPPAGLPAELLERRPDLRAAEQRVAVAFNLTESARAARLPQIGLTLGGGAASGDLTNLLGGDKAFWNAGANFLAPIYTGGALEAQVKIENARQEQALSAYGGLALRAFGDVENALGNEVLLAEREGYIAAAAADYNKVYDLTNEEYKVGKVSLFNVLQAQQRYLTSQVAEIRIHSERLAERVDLHLALGGGFE